MKVIYLNRFQNPIKICKCIILILIGEGVFSFYVLKVTMKCLFNNMFFYAVKAVWTWNGHVENNF